MPRGYRGLKPLSIVWNDPSSTFGMWWSGVCDATTRSWPQSNSNSNAPSQKTEAFPTNTQKKQWRGKGHTYGRSASSKDPEALGCRPEVYWGNVALCKLCTSIFFFYVVVKIPGQRVHKEGQTTLRSFTSLTWRFSCSTPV